MAEGREYPARRIIGGRCCSLERVVDEELLEDLRLARLPDLAGQEHLVHDAVHLHGGRRRRDDT